VKLLAAVFEDIYHYNVTNVVIDGGISKLPQIQMNMAVAQFVDANDKDDTLFIVYYAGHGSPGKNIGDLRLSGYVEKSRDVL